MGRISILLLEINLDLANFLSEVTGIAKDPRIYDVSRDLLTSYIKFECSHKMLTLSRKYFLRLLEGAAGFASI